MIEINDNSSIDAGIEDAVAGTTRYRTIMPDFLRRREFREQGVA